MSQPGSGPQIAARKPVSLNAPPIQPIQMTPLTSAGLPLIAASGGSGMNLADWAAPQRAAIDERLRAAGAILFAGFAVFTLEDFQAFVTAVAGDLLEYTYRSTPRTQVSGRIYTSTEYAADQRIPLHNENAYSHTWPLTIAFYCKVAAERGGETPIADSRVVYNRIPARIRQQFADKGVLYARNYTNGVDLPWSTVFQTDDPTEVERACRAADIQCQWGPDGRLQTRQRRPGVARHPRTGDMVWFNQAHLFHVQALPEGVRDALREQFADEELPRHAYFGDGTPIAAGIIDEINAIYDTAAVTFSWKPQDVLLLDNMLVAHGRRPYSGARQVLVAMAEPCEDAHA